MVQDVLGLGALILLIFLIRVVGAILSKIKD